MKQLPVSKTRTVLSQIMTPLDANILGNVFGGSILSMIDLTASATAQKYSGHTCVTASFDRVDFHEPIAVGSLVEMEGYVGYAGRTSMEIVIDVFSTNLKEGYRRQTNTARVTMVAIENGKPVPVPTLVCESREDKIRYVEGKLRKEIRSKYLSEIKALDTVFEAMEESKLDELIASSSVAEALNL
jgi:acyl-CoA hydrolase